MQWILMDPNVGYANQPRVSQRSWRNQPGTYIAALPSCTYFILVPIGFQQLVSWQRIPRQTSLETLGYQL